MIKCISQYLWTSLEYRGYLYTCYLWLRLWHIKAHGDLCAPSLSLFWKTKMTSTHKWDMIKRFYTLYSFWEKPFLKILVWWSLYVCYIHDLEFNWQCRVFKIMDMTNIIKVATAAFARTWLVRYLKKYDFFGLYIFHYSEVIIFLLSLFFLNWICWNEGFLLLFV